MQLPFYDNSSLEMKSILCKKEWEHLMQKKLKVLKYFEFIFH